MCTFIVISPRNVRATGIHISGADECFDSSDAAYGEHQLMGEMQECRVECNLDLCFGLRSARGLAAWLTGVRFTDRPATRAIRRIPVYTKIKFLAIVRYRSALSTP